MDVNSFIACTGDALKSRMARDSVLLLEKLGCRVDLPGKQRCYGRPTINNDYIKEAAPGMKSLIAVPEDNDDPIISLAGSCTYAVKSYPTYLAGKPEWASRATKVVAHMQDLTSFVVNKLGIVDVNASLQGRAVCHPSCGLAHKLGVKDELLTLLKDVRGLELLVFAEQDTYCGFSDMFSVKMTEISGEMVREEAAHLMEIRPGYLIGADVSYLLNISERLQREGQKAKVMHIVEVLMSH